MNWLLFLIILFMPQNGDTKDYVVNISKTERIKVKVDTACEPILPSSKLKYAIYLAGELKTINVKIWNYTNHNLTFIILHNECFYGERIITEVETGQVFVGPVTLFKSKKVIVKPNSFISSKIPIPIKYENRMVNSFVYKINYLTHLNKSNSINIHSKIIFDKLEISKVENKNLDRE